MIQLCSLSNPWGLQRVISRCSGPSPVTLWGDPDCGGENNEELVEVQEIQSLGHHAFTRNSPQNLSYIYTVINFTTNGMLRARPAWMVRKSRVWEYSYVLLSCVCFFSRFQGFAQTLCPFYNCYILRNACTNHLNT